jgi:hypothetical protein
LESPWCVPLLRQSFLLLVLSIGIARADLWNDQSLNSSGGDVGSTVRMDYASGRYDFTFGPYDGSSGQMPDVDYIGFNTYLLPPKPGIRTFGCGGPWYGPREFDRSIGTFRHFECGAGLPDRYEMDRGGISVHVVMLHQPPFYFAGLRRRVFPDFDDSGATMGWGGEERSSTVVPHVVSEPSSIGLLLLALPLIARSLDRHSKIVPLTHHRGSGDDPAEATRARANSVLDHDARLCR